MKGELKGYCHVKRSASGFVKPNQPTLCLDDEFFNAACTYITAQVDETAASVQERFAQGEHKNQLCMDCLNEMRSTETKVSQ